MLKVSTPPGSLLKNSCLRIGLSFKTILDDDLTWQLAFCARVLIQQSETFYTLNHIGDHIGKENRKNNHRKYSHNCRYCVYVRYELFLTVREMHAVKYETKHQHYVDEIDEVDDTVVELCWGEVVLDCG